MKLREASHALTWLALALLAAYWIGTVAADGDWRIVLLPAAPFAALLILVRPQVGVYLIPLAFLFLSTEMDQLPGPFFADSVAEWLIYSATLGTAIRLARSKRMLVHAGRLGAALAIYAAAVCVQLTRPGEAGGTMKLALYYFLPVLMYFLTATFVNSARQVERLVLVLLSALLLYFGIRIYFTVPTLTPTAEVFARGAGEWTQYWFLVNKGIVWLANMIAPWALVLGVAYPSRAVRWLGLSVSGAAIFYSLTSSFRGGMIGILVGAVAVLVSTRVLASHSRRKVGVLLVLFLVGVSVMMLHRVGSTVVEERLTRQYSEKGLAARWNAYSSDWRHFLSKPLTGGGIYASTNHSYFLSILANWGLLVGVPVAWLWSLLIAERYRLWRKARSPHLRAIAAASFAAFWPTVVDSLLDATFIGPVFACLFWTLCGINAVSLRFAQIEERLSGVETAPLGPGVLAGSKLVPREAG